MVAAIFTMKKDWPVIESVSIKKNEDRNPGLNLDLSLSLTQGFWYFARSRSREIPRNSQYTSKTAKFGRNLIKYMPVQHSWNIGAINLP